MYVNMYYIENQWMSNMWNCWRLKLHIFKFSFVNFLVKIFSFKTSNSYSNTITHSTLEIVCLLS